MDAASKRSITQFGCSKLYCLLPLLLSLLILTPSLSFAATNPDDVVAINGLYAALGAPSLPGWTASGGDPCGEAWQGVICNVSDVIISITVNAANLEGELGDNLSKFTSIRGIDFSNNRIGGYIPTNLPVTLQHFFLSANQFTGSIPESLGTLSSLSDMSLNDNQLSGELPDVFQNLVGLINLDISANNLSGTLPPSMESLSALTTLHVQNNQISGTLDVLQVLPLQDLNIENNLFSGPIPEKLLSIPTFLKDGNQFNSTTLAPSLSPSTSPTRPFFGVPPPPPPPERNRGKIDGEPPSPKEQKSSSQTTRIVLIAIAGVVLFIILVLALLLLLPKCLRRRRRRERASSVFKPHQVGAADRGNRENALENGPPLLPPPVRSEKVPFTKAGQEPKVLHDIERLQRPITRQESQDIDFSTLTPPPPPLPPPPPPPAPPVVTFMPIKSPERPFKKPSPKTRVPLTSVKHYSVASLQQYTESFSQENLLGSGMLGSVYKARLPDGKLFAVKKLDKRACEQQQDHEFIELVNDIDRIRHANIVELVGYCAEHDQRLLIYEYCSNGTLQDGLHSDDEFKKKLSWNKRVRMALGAARALEYLHEVCEPPVIHRNFKSVNVLLDDDLSVLVSDCGQLLAAYGYGAPEFDSGVYTWQSDVYSFGVVMLELLTGRMSYDRDRSRAEQFLVRWAVPQLHDIDALGKMVDPSLNGQYPAKSLSHFADIISRCVQSEPEFRPLMSEVVQDLLDMIRRERHGSGEPSAD
ncbi:hypothetical protein IGI04_032911 [Brassica rapa subsp. trilocularis]|uniref:Protein kinase domain-containing protein n=1 Tax=Brassica rapa subsp. trilocularis TaxID=1813537 RepID=A0ABQ7L876_BRACM|nr:hypothetical protein IGI04_032911 [Brassica rapa subsp. trilocularis]